MSKKVYAREDIYEGMVLVCVESEYPWWTVGKQYIVDKDLCIYDDGDIYRSYSDFNLCLGNGDKSLNFKVVEPEEPQDILQLFNYTFGLKTGDVETRHDFNKKHITIPAYNTQQAIEYLTNELEYDINDIVSMEVQ